MQSKRLLTLVIAGSVVALVFLLFALRMQGENKTDQSILVVSAAQEIPSGKPMVAEQLKLIKVAQSTVPSGISLRVESLVGRIPRATIKANQIVLESMLYSRDASAGLAFSITPGKRAITLNVNEVSGVAGFVLPGSYVDLLYSSRDNIGHSQSRIILQNILVLAVAQDRAVGGDEGKPKLVPSVTVELSPQDAETLDAARQTGNINLMLRNQSEPSHSVEKMTPPAATHHESGVEVIRGTTVRIESGSGRSNE
jgi:pilus assembly protein CpaB